VLWADELGRIIATLVTADGIGIVGEPKTLLIGVTVFVTVLLNSDDVA